MRLLRASLPERPAVDAALGPVLLRRAGEPLVRVSRPGPTVGFGRLDRIRPGFAAAVAVARAHGFTPVVRAPGGHAAAYHHGSVVFEVIAADPDPVRGMRGRFAWAAEVVAGTLRGLGVDARIGPVPGEYCSGEHSVNGEGRVKLAGIAQRLVRSAWMLGVEVVVEDGEPVRRVLADVYAALGLELDPSTSAAVEDLAPGLTVDAVEAALVVALGVTSRVPLEPELVAEAEAEAAAAQAGLP